MLLTILFDLLTQIILTFDTNVILTKVKKSTIIIDQLINGLLLVIIKLLSNAVVCIIH